MPGVPLPGAWLGPVSVSGKRVLSRGGPGSRGHHRLLLKVDTNTSPRASAGHPIQPSVLVLVTIIGRRLKEGKNGIKCNQWRHFQD